MLSVYVRLLIKVLTVDFHIMYSSGGNVVIRRCMQLCGSRVPSHFGLVCARHFSESSSSSSDDEGVPVNGPQYTGHIPTSFRQKLLLSLGSAAVAITSPWRGDMIATLGETTGYFAIKDMQSRMMKDPVGRQILEEQPRINTASVNLDDLRALPEDTFGREYVRWLDYNKANPDEREPVAFVDDPDLAYVMQRYREVHDLFHTVLGMPTHMLGEVTVKWFEAVQTGLPMCALGALFGPIRLGPVHRQKYFETHLWWAIRNGRNAKYMMSVYFEKHWEKPLTQLRHELNLEEPPVTPPLKGKVTSNGI